MVMQPVAQRTYRLRNGELGTEYEALVESLEFWKAKLQQVEDEIEEIQRKLELAEDRP